MLDYDENSLPTVASVSKHSDLHEICNIGDPYFVVLLLSPTVQKY
jgi:hypothetical protein